MRPRWHADEVRQDQPEAPEVTAPGLSRRQALGLFAGATASLACSPAQAVMAHERAAAALQDAAATGISCEPRFFTAHEFSTVRVLVDMIIPADERSGSATDAGVPEFMDFMMDDQPERQLAMRGGLAWLDHEAQERCDERFVDCAPTQREQVLDAIAWPERAPQELRHGVAFFNAFRDLTATGFWTSKMGVEDLQYMGNEYVSRWDGCPPEQLRRLGLID